MAWMEDLTCIQSLSFEYDKPVYKGKTYDGTPRRRDKHTKQIVSISVSYSVRTWAEVDSVLSHFVANNNTSFYFYQLWENPGDYTAGNKIEPVWYDGKPQYRRLQGGHYTIDIKLEAVI